MVVVVVHAISEESSGNGAEDSEGGPHESLGSIRRQVSVDLYAQIGILVLVREDVLDHADVVGAVDNDIGALGVETGRDLIGSAATIAIPEVRLGLNLNARAIPGDLGVHEDVEVAGGILLEPVLADISVVLRNVVHAIGLGDTIDFEAGSCRGRAKQGHDE